MWGIPPTVKTVGFLPRVFVKKFAHIFYSRIMARIWVKRYLSGHGWFDFEIREI